MEAADLERMVSAAVLRETAALREEIKTCPPPNQGKRVATGGAGISESTLAHCTKGSRRLLQVQALVFRCACRNLGAKL